MIYPNVKKAPGGKMNTKMFVVSGNKATPKRLPAPNISRAQPNKVNARVNPKPHPKPSKRLANGLFLAAKLSARPRMIQFTTIRGM